MASLFRHNSLLIILIGAFALRGIAAVMVQNRLDQADNGPFVIAGDAAGYWELGRKMAAGQEFSLYKPPRRVHRMPGFPTLLALSQTLFGDSFLASRLLLAAVGTLACWLVFLLGRELLNEQVGLIAAGLTAVMPVMIGFSVLILSETLFAVCLLGSLYFLARLSKIGFDPAVAPRAVTYSVWAGGMIAAATYVRPSWVLVVPIAAIAVVILADNKKQALLRGLLISMAAFAALLPWAYRNYRVTNHWVFTTLWAGPSLYDGLNPEATGDSDMRFFDRERVDLKMTEYEVDQHYRQRAMQFAADNPGRTLQLAVAKAIRFWKPWPNAAQFEHVGYRLAVALFFIPLMVCAVRGWWDYRRQFWVWLLTLGPVLYFFLIHLVFVGSLRYRLPAEYPLCVLSAAGLQSWFKR